LTFEKHKNKVLPHGQEWKIAFKELFEPLLEEELLPTPLISVLKNYLKNPSASSMGHGPLVEVLKTFEKETSELVAIHSLKEDQTFSIKNLRFKKGKLQRTRYICKEISSGKLYLVSKNAQVRPIDLESKSN
jgi:hypothetical protein